MDSLKLMAYTQLKLQLATMNIPKDYLRYALRPYPGPGAEEDAIMTNALAGCDRLAIVNEEPYLLLAINHGIDKEYFVIPAWTVATLHPLWGDPIVYRTGKPGWPHT